ncbi:hypothetical protein KUV95_15840 [Microbulbifer agarilyticus]|uniref:hypothetical protein n=1 Tax=Microbulbifer agarilyticus TaxID=260552 RepID=UPI001C961728|nr:hypothetical protein [Microbulbifer agarilyticus]MBY6213024.1 hypothetical protein [Microbulbifer agarilyticus]
MKNIAEQANNIINSQAFHSLQSVKNNLSDSSSGFYWIYTKLKISDLKLSTSPTNQAHVKINDLATIHENLPNVIPESNLDYWCIYNGKGKNLKNRINAEFSNTSGCTGTLALKRCFQESDFNIKFVECCSGNFNHTYQDIEAHLERVWRLSFGWPILCRA